MLSMLKLHRTGISDLDTYQLVSNHHLGPRFDAANEGLNNMLIGMTMVFCWRSYLKSRVIPQPTEDWYLWPDEFGCSDCDSDTSFCVMCEWL